MAARRLPLGLLAPISLLILVVALGALQYRWVGQVSEAERAQLTQSLDRRAREFAEDFDRQISRAYDLFRLPASFSVETPDAFTKKFDDWQATAPFAGLIQSVYYVQTGGQELVLQRFDPATRAFAPAGWPQSLAAVRNRVRLSVPHTVQTPAGRANVVSLAAAPVMADVPALVIPQALAPSDLPAAFPNSLKRLSSGNVDVMVHTVSAGPHDFIVLELDRGFIASTMLPALIERHFADNGADRFRVSVVSPGGEAVLTRGLPANHTLTAATADAEVPFFGIRFETIRVSPSKGAAVWSAQVRERSALDAGARAAVEARARASQSGEFTFKKPGTGPDQMSMVIDQQHTAAITGATMTATAVGVPVSPSWRILLQHAAGSLDAAVANARRRNLWLSFGILGVLATSTFLVLLNARRSEKLAAQQMDFVATVSHELRTPVAVIRSAAQNLSAGVIQDADQARRYGDLIDTEGRRLTDMVEQVLEYAGLSGNRRPAASRPVDVASLVHDVVNTSLALPESHEVAFDVRVDENVPPVIADPDALRRALLNLVSNALKYADDGRWIGITVSRSPGRDGGQVLVSVTDRGRGIPADDLAHIFEPFYRGRFARDQQIHGNGLGLSLVKRIAEAHGGRVTVKSAPGQGSTFTIALPAASGSTAQVPVHLT